MAVTSADVLSDFDVTVWQGSDSNANKLGLGAKFQAVQEEVVALQSTANGNGASDIGLEDAAGTFTAADVEAAIAEARTKLSTVPITSVVIAGGVATVTTSQHSIDTEGAAASDDLDTITGLQDGQFLIVGLVDAGRNVVIKSGTGNITCPNGADITLDAQGDRVVIVRSGAALYVVGMELAAFAGGGIGLVLNSGANGQGASRIALEDATAWFTTDNVESALAALAEYQRGSTVNNRHSPIYYKGSYSFATHGGIVGNNPVTGATIPTQSNVTRFFFFVSVPFTSGGAAEIAWTLESAGDLFPAEVIATAGTAGNHEAAAPLVPPVGTTAERTVTLAVSVAALTAGVATFWVQYVR